MHVQHEIAVPAFFDIHCVVEIARGFAIDGDNRQVAEIAPALDLADVDRCGHRACLFDDIFRKLVRDMMLPDHDLDVHAEIVRIAEDLDHAPHGVAAVLGEIEHLDVHHHAVHVFGR